MFTVRGMPIMADELSVLQELKNQLAMNGIHRFKKFKVLTDHIQFCCPFHKDGQESKPSCGITTNDIKYGDGRVVKAGSVHCFTCGTTCNLAEMISYLFGRNDFGVFGDEWLLKNFVNVKYENREDLQINFERNKKIETPKIEYVSEEELDSYRYTHPYMYQRKLTDEVIEMFDVGYDKDFVLKNQNGRVSHLRCITFPVRDETGGTLFIARRSVDTKFFHYPSGAKKPVYGLYELSKIDPYPKEVYICESIIDCLTLWSVGKYAVALNGLGTEQQMKQLRKLPVREYVLATDSDKAGMGARNKIRQSIKNKLITEIILPDGRKDINECSESELLNLQKVL